MFFLAWSCNWRTGNRAVWASLLFIVSTKTQQRNWSVTRKAERAALFTRSPRAFNMCRSAAVPSVFEPFPPWNPSSVWSGRKYLLNFGNALKGSKAATQRLSRSRFWVLMRSPKKPCKFTFYAWGNLPPLVNKARKSKILGRAMPVVHLPIAMVTLLVDWGYGDFLVSPHSQMQFWNVFIPLIRSCDSFAAQVEGFNYSVSSCLCSAHGLRILELFKWFLTPWMLPLGQQ